MAEAPLKKRYTDQLDYDPRRSEKYNEIIRAAVKLFKEKGYKATSIRDIAASINLTQGTIYHYVKNKEDLLFEINDRLINSVLQGRKEILELKCPSKDKLRRTIKEILTTIATYNDYISVFLKEYKNLSNKNLKKISKKRDRYENMVESIIQEGIENKEFKKFDSKISTMALFGICNWATTWLRPNGRLPIDEIAEIFSTIYLEGLCCPKDNSQRRE